MGPKKTQSAEEVDEIKKSLDFLAGEISAVRLQQKASWTWLRRQALEYLESRLEDLEQYTRINDVIITGLKVRPRHMPGLWALTPGGEPGELDDNSTEQQVAAFLQSKGIQLDCNNIEACHPLPRRKDSDNPAIMRFEKKTQDQSAKTGKKAERIRCLYE
ncbi:hypothetical protein F7725_007415 [Dissostichus mawsoni]|uniref:Uncharacterized protein n=1 Tax=Dissostichus mawsoni TaxID=36200 RepID=A0A7J5XXM3_DISMA|nr:hypothetical protein F7725_007415 [Dissostichus mawsoni]